MSNLLLITDMARIRKVFDRLADDNTFTLRVVNNLERGGEEIIFQKPDVVFVQTHLSGLSPDILLMHLKKQLGRKRSRFVLLATPGQVSDTILKHYHGWLDISCKESELLPAVQNLLTSLLSKNKKADGNIKPEEKPAAVTAAPEPAPIAPSSAPSAIHPFAVSGANGTTHLPVSAAEASLEEQGIIYPRRSRLSVYSEFNSSFDSAVSKTEEPASLELAAPAQEYNNWTAELIDTAEPVAPRSKHSIFLLWLAPVVVAVVVVTFLQKNRTESKSAPILTPPVTSSSPPAKTVDPPVPVAEPIKPAVVAKPDQDSKMTDKAVITAIAENRGSNEPSPVSASGSRPTVLPDFIPRNGFDKQYGIANPGWERYKGQVTEFKVYREAQTIKAIQVIDRGGQGVPESFAKGVLRQVAKDPVFTAETSEKKEGYEIQRGRISETCKVVYYRDQQGGKLRAFVMSWQ